MNTVGIGNLKTGMFWLSNAMTTGTMLKSGFWSNLCVWRLSSKDIVGIGRVDRLATAPSFVTRTDPVQCTGRQTEMGCQPPIYLLYLNRAHNTKLSSSSWRPPMRWNPLVFVVDHYHNLCADADAGQEPSRPCTTVEGGMSPNLGRV